MCTKYERINYTAQNRILILQKNKINFKIFDVTTWLTNNYNTHIAQYLTKKK